MKRLTRSDDSWIAGVCGGIGEYAGVDANLVRLATAVAFVFTGFFPLAFLYALAWIIMPKQG